MKNIRVNLKDKEIVSLINSEEHSLTVVFSYKKRGKDEMCNVSISGTDLSSNKSYKWLGESIETPSEVVISIDDSQNNLATDPIQVLSIEENFVENQKLKTYHHLKNELELKGLI